MHNKIYIYIYIKFFNILNKIYLENQILLNLNNNVTQYKENFYYK